MTQLEELINQARLAYKATRRLERLLESSQAPRVGHVHVRKLRAQEEYLSTLIDALVALLGPDEPTPGTKKTLQLTQGLLWGGFPNEDS